MEIFQDIIEKMGLSSKRLTMVICCLITLSILLMVTMTCQNSTFVGFGKTKLMERVAQNVTAEVMGGSVQNNTALEVASRNDSFVGSKNDSHLPASNPVDKLFDGLLASGFDKGSCLSRYQSYLYGKISPHMPSQYLISKLGNYEDLYRRCGPHTKSYNRTIRKLKKSSRINNGTTACSYIVWLSSNGLGNRMVSIASTFLYAVLTDRVLLVNFEADMDRLFCEPFPNSSWILPKDFPYDNRKRLQTYERLLKNSEANSSIQVSSSFLYVDLQHRHDEHDKLFHSDLSQALLHKIPVLILKSDQYFVPSLFMTPSFKQELSKMFPEKETVFHHLGHYLFHPSNEAWGLISRFYQAYLAKADERIGLQIRVFNTTKTPYQTVMDQILACTLKHKVLPEVDMRKSVNIPSKNVTSKAILVASLHSEYAENLRAMYWTKPTVTGEVIGIYQPSHDEYQKFNDNIQNMKAWVEIYLLSLCDVLVTSSQSTLGYVAQSLGGLKPWILEKAESKITPDPPCKPALSMEPCFHFPPNYDGKEKTKVDVTHHFPYMRPCEDLSWGVKLVNDHE